MRHVLAGAWLATLTCCSLVSDFDGLTDGNGVGGGAEGECARDEDCTEAPANDCLRPICGNGQCGVGTVVDGVPTNEQDPGDCRVLVCDGSGSVRSEVDDTDTPTSENPCQEGVCAEGTPDFMALPEGTVCNPARCENGASTAAVSAPDTCDDAGMCRDGGLGTDCTPFGCSEESGTPECRVSCEAEDECAPMHTCDGSSCT